MTGFGSHRFRGRDLELDVHVKSVNGRFLEVRVHLPKEFISLEADVRRELKGWDRGTVDISVQRRPRREANRPAVRINAAQAAHWAKSLRDLKRQLKISEDITLREILAMPRVLETDEPSADVSGEGEALLSATRRAVAACARVRKSEGGRLKREIIKQLTALEQLVTQISSAQDDQRRVTEERIDQRVSSLVGEQLDPARVAIETALVMDRADVREELVRLREHVRACRALLRAGDARGKKLDFYAQELLREVNTIGSKSPGARVTALVVDAKSVIEKYREQVQNIE